MLFDDVTCARWALVLDAQFECPDPADQVDPKFLYVVRMGFGGFAKALVSTVVVTAGDACKAAAC